MTSRVPEGPAGEPEHVRVVGRFAPSPTGPLHFGSLVAAAGSYLFAKKAGGEWIVRIEDLDTARVVPGAAEEILATLTLYGLESDRPPVYQSKRTTIYESALEVLRNRGLAYDCCCSRSELARAASAPAADDPIDSESRVYPGTCRGGLPSGRSPRSVRFRVPAGTFSFDDLVWGEVNEDVAHRTGDFVVRRADGVFAYQLAVVVDDAAQGVTQVVRGADLLSSTARQVALASALGLASPVYAHIPMIVGPDGAKLGKRHESLPLIRLGEAGVTKTLRRALSVLGAGNLDGDSPSALMEAAVARFNPSSVPRLLTDTGE